jgi:capsular polysaccharide biosynthesis protein
MTVRPLIIAARYKLLLILPFLVILPIAAALSYLNVKTEYFSSSTLWAEDSVFLDSVVSNNPYSTPAQNRANDLNELLSTDSFRSGVAERADMPDGPASWREISDGTFAYASGRHLVVVGKKSSDPARAQLIVNALVDEFREQYSENTRQTAENARPIFEERRLADQVALDKANEEYAAHIQSRGVNASVTDPRALELQSTVARAQSALNDTVRQLREIELLTASTEAALQRTVRIVDEPTLPTEPLTVSKRALVGLPAAGLLLALSIAAALYAFLLKTDNNIRVADDLSALPGLLLLGTIPDASSARRRGWPRHYFRVAVAAIGHTIRV